MWTDREAQGETTSSHTCKGKNQTDNIINLISHFICLFNSNIIAQYNATPFVLYTEMKKCIFT